MAICRDNDAVSHINANKMSKTGGALAAFFGQHWRSSYMQCQLVLFEYAWRSTCILRRSCCHKMSKTRGYQLRYLQVGKKKMSKTGGYQLRYLQVGWFNSANTDAAAGTKAQILALLQQKDWRSSCILPLSVERGRKSRKRALKQL